MKKIFAGILCLLFVVLILFFFWRRKDEKIHKEILHNAYIVYSNNDKLYVFSDGEYRTFALKSERTLKNCIADIEIKGKNVVKLILKNEYLDKKLVSSHDDYLCVEGYGNIPKDKNIRYYEAMGQVKEKDMSDFMASYDYRFFVAEGKVAAVVQTTKKQEVVSTIRVLIKSSGYEKYYHESIKFRGDKGLKISGVQDVSDIYEINQSDISEGDIIKIEPCEDGGIYLENVIRNTDDIRYGGAMYVYGVDEGLVLINEVSVEEYLRLVVPSEMPYTYEMEALKAQAVCARTYAYKHIKNPALLNLGAHLDDSVAFQVYGNLPGNTRCDEAIFATKGQVLSDMDDLVNTNYYSTSCGYGANEEIWGNQTNNRNLIAHAINEKANVTDMSDESTFYNFITTENESDYDFTYPYYRWSGKINMDGLTQYAKVGKIQDIKVTKRLSCGSVKELTIIGDKGKSVIENQYEIRKFLGDCGYSITNKSGSDVNTALLPSAFFVIDYSQGECLIRGGGLGHGLGMSQNGANFMAQKKKKYDDILHFFFRNSTITRMA